MSKMTQAPTELSDKIGPRLQKQIEGDPTFPFSTHIYLADTLAYEKTKSVPLRGVQSSSFEIPIGVSLTHTGIGVIKELQGMGLDVEYVTARKSYLTAVMDGPAVIEAVEIEGVERIISFSEDEQYEVRYSSIAH